MEATRTISDFQANNEGAVGEAEQRAANLVPRYREIRKTHSAEIDLANSIEELWPYLSDTDRIESEAGFNPARYTWSENQDGRLLHGTTSLPGGVAVEYTEMPFEWEYLKWHSLERVFHKGPFEYFRGRFDFTELPDQGTRVRITLDFVPRYRLLPTGLLFKGFMKAIRSAVKRLDANLTAELAAGARSESDAGDLRPASPGSFEQAGLGAANPADENLRRKIRELEKKWSGLTPDTRIPSALSEFILTRPDNVAARLRPFELAQYLSLDPMETLTFCLRAVKQGHLEMSWDILCPSCRGSAERSTNLSAVGTETHCDACDIRYDVEFDKHVELTFRPSPSTRTIDATVFCPAAPSRTRHVLAQHFVLPGEERLVEAGNFPAHVGREFTLRGQDANDLLAPATGASGRSVLDLNAKIANQAASPGDTLTLRNSGDQVRVLKLETTLRDARIVTADLVTSLQEFRSHFSSEVLRPGVQLGVANLTIMFSDLKGSTRMYEVRGDAPAFALVQDHFERLTKITAENRGAVVKTIGDAVMAVYKEPAHAIRAAWRILSEEQGDMMVKLGLHNGPCIALNLNDKLDYFGGTVNRAARLQGQARGGDLVISEELFRRPEVRAVLKEFKQSIRISRFQTTLRGMRGENTLYRIQPVTARGVTQEAV